MPEKSCSNCEYWKFSKDWSIGIKSECTITENEVISVRGRDGSEGCIFTAPTHLCSQYTKKK